MYKKLITISTLSLAVFATSTSCYAAKRPSLHSRAETEMPIVQAVASNAKVIQAVQMSNQQMAKATPKQLLQFERNWRAELKSHKGAMLEKITKSKLSQQLNRSLTATQNKLLNLIILNNKGIVIAASKPPQNYWQEHKAIWRKSFLGGASANYISRRSDIDKTTKQRYMAASLPILNKEKKVIGVVAAKLNVKQLQTRSKKKA